MYPARRTTECVSISHVDTQLSGCLSGCYCWFVKAVSAITISQGAEAFCSSACNLYTLAQVDRCAVRSGPDPSGERLARLDHIFNGPHLPTISISSRGPPSGAVSRRLKSQPPA